MGQEGEGGSSFEGYFMAQKRKSNGESRENPFG